MSTELYLAYLLATAIVLVVPGPTILLVISYGLERGRASVWATAPGVVLGDFTCMTCSFLGLGALLAASSAVFLALKWLGACYLVYLGVRMWRSRPDCKALGPASAEARGAAPCRRPRWRMFGHAYLVTATNPKGIIFFTAFLPQFMDHAAPVLPQMAVLGSTFLILALVNAVAYGLLAGGVRSALSSPSVLRTANRIGGGLLIGAGVMTATLRRS
ncbi:MAG: LysE family translocator [Desulfovibrionaceae bacterium]|jgi:threonine/homoserine/homoserine lactone efflux protein|nr:LysE family translocator [Desulfovibrionaceae bacterium]